MTPEQKKHITREIFSQMREACLQIGENAMRQFGPDDPNLYDCLALAYRFMVNNLVKSEVCCRSLEISDAFIDHKVPYEACDEIAFALNSIYPLVEQKLLSSIQQVQKRNSIMNN